jgi:hypothetical protein
MESDSALDLMDELAGLFREEDLVAFFEFRHESESGQPLSGLCKIAVPKKDSGKMNYLSLLFIVDIPDDAARRESREMENALVRNAVSRSVPEVITVLSPPAADPAPEIRLKQMDLILDPETKVDGPFVANRLYPALAESGTMKAGELVWFEDLPGPSCEVPEKVFTIEEMDRSFFDRLRNLFRSSRS